MSKVENGAPQTSDATDEKETVSDKLSKTEGTESGMVAEKHPEAVLDEGYDELPPPEPTVPKEKVALPDSDDDPSENVIEEGDEDNASAYEEKPPIIPEIVVDEEDEEVRIAMEMALAAMKNPHLSPEEIRKKVLNEQNPQSDFIKQVEEKKKKKVEKEREEAEKRWNEQKESVTSWFNWGASTLIKVSEEYEWTQAKIKYADNIKADKKVQKIRIAIKARKKSVKAIKLQGNRVETRHVFKRQRMEKHLIEVNDAIEKYRHQFCETNYNATAYAKAMMKAAKKWNKPTGTDQELALESQLCRNMHQMLVLEKQKSKLKKSLKELKKYLQRCKSWLTDKHALCEQHALTLSATQASMLGIYQDTLSRQDAFIAKILQENKESLGGDDSPQKLAAAAPVELRQKYDSLPRGSGPGATLSALRGLPFKDSIYLKSGSLDGDRDDDDDNKGEAAKNNKVVIDGAPPSSETGGRHELILSLADDGASINSALTDPDDDGGAGVPPTTDADSVSGNIAFGEDAPWLGDDEELGNADAKDLAKTSSKDPKKVRPPPKKVVPPAAATSTNQNSNNDEAKKERKKVVNGKEGVTTSTSNGITNPAAASNSKPSKSSSGAPPTSKESLRKSAERKEASNTKPAPTTTKPVPTTTKPAPTTTKPVPTTTKPVPTTTKPAPATTKPAPTTTKPVPTTTTKPATTTTKVAPVVSKV